MKLYLAGPMTGLPEFNYPMFNRYAQLLRERGHEVFNPAEAHDGETGLPLEKYFEQDLPEVCRADAVAVLPGWQGSRGAQIEVELARHLGKTVYEAVLLASSDPNTDAEVREGDDYGAGQPLAVDQPIPGDEGYASWEQPEGDLGGYGQAIIDGDTGQQGFVFYEHDPERHTSQDGGVKDNVNKPRVDLIPSAPLFEAGKVLAFGARKYKPHNWRLGLSWLETYGSLQRHLLAWLDGEENDRESGYSHIAHAVCQMLFLAEFTIRGTGTDDRFVSLDREEMKTDEPA